ncbi:hypothetical protein [Methylobacterium ajmalii]|uniref:hypothetical protein n=1 Tax=Methylobacterium ajmalii TaxID=2738439 RepID=UPI002F2C954F
MTDAPSLIKLRYVGTRFEGGRLPLDVLSDLPAFRDLLAAFARDTWLNENSARQRVPKGFESSISFSLVAVEDGSAVPCLKWDREAAYAALPSQADTLDELISASYDQLVSLFDKAGKGVLPAFLSPGHIRALDRLGSGLQDNERIEFEGAIGSDGNVIFVDFQRRKNLITHVKETYLAKFEGSGRLTSNREDGSILIHTEQHGEITIAVGPEAVLGTFDGNLGRDVQFHLIIELDHLDKIRSLREIIYIDLVDDEAAIEFDRCNSRLAELSSLRDGWNDGDGSSISKTAIDAARQLVARRPGLSAIFRIYPTNEGGVSFEFQSGNWDYSVEFHADGSIEMYGVELNGSNEMDPTQFDGPGDAFTALFDSRVAR